MGGGCVPAAVGRCAAMQACVADARAGRAAAGQTRRPAAGQTPFRGRSSAVPPPVEAVPRFDRRSNAAPPPTLRSRWMTFMLWQWATTFGGVFGVEVFGVEVFAGGVCITG